jgi:hypothetical protein
MSLKVGEIGKIINVNAKFDMSGNTDLEINFIKTDLSTLTVNKAGGVSAPAIPFTDPDTGEIFAANEYWSYATKSGDIDQSGAWTLSGRYIDATPKDFCGDTANFTVLPCG